MIRALMKKYREQKREQALLILMQQLKNRKLQELLGKEAFSQLIFISRHRVRDASITAVALRNHLKSVEYPAVVIPEPVEIPDKYFGDPTTHLSRGWGFYWHSPEIQWDKKIESFNWSPYVRVLPK